MAKQETRTETTKGDSGRERERVTQAEQNSSESASEREHRCPECDAAALAKQGGELICEECGLVVDNEQIDRGAEWRAFNQQEREEKSRVGAPTTQIMHDKGLSTQIGWKDTDGYGNAITGKRREQLQRLRKWDERFRTRDSGERNLKYALGEIDRMSSAIGIPREVQEIASVIYRRTLREDLLRGRSIEGVASAALYTACRQQGIARSLNEIQAISRIGYDEIARTYRYIARELALEMEPVDPKSYIPRFASDLDLGQDVQNQAKQLLEVAGENGLISGKSPHGLAAAALYGASLICGERRTQTEIAEIAKVTQVTIRNRYQEQFEAMGIRNA